MLLWVLAWFCVFFACLRGGVGYCDVVLWFGLRCLRVWWFVIRSVWLLMCCYEFWFVLYILCLLAWWVSLGGCVGFRLIVVWWFVWVVSWVVLMSIRLDLGWLWLRCWILCFEFGFCGLVV